MTKEQWLLVKLIEECGEVTHECTKALTYGLDHTNPHNDRKNIDNLINGLNDVIGVLKILAEYHTIPSGPDDVKVCQKIAKINKSMDYAKELGVITE
jgi:NTP pyrophosphatase (non-canonical NTP hydrolase)